MANTRSRILTLLLAIFLSASVDALEVLNKRTSTLTVFAPPICEPCVCPRPGCFCTMQCKFMPGVDVKPGEAKTIPVRKEDFPLAFLTVEFEGAAYNVRAEDLESIKQFAIVVVSEEECGKEGVVAHVFKKPKYAKGEWICLVRGERYGS